MIKKNFFLDRRYLLRLKLIHVSERGYSGQFQSKDATFSV